MTCKHPIWPTNLEDWFPIEVHIANNLGLLEFDLITVRVLTQDLSSYRLKGLQSQFYRNTDSPSKVTENSVRKSAFSSFPASLYFRSTSSTLGDSTFIPFAAQKAALLLLLVEAKELHFRCAEELIWMRRLHVTRILELNGRCLFM